MLSVKKLQARSLCYTKSLKLISIAAAFSFLLNACDSGGGSSSSQPDPIGADEQTFRLGGIARGLTGVATITNGEVEFTLTRNGDFVFTEEFESGTAYDVRLKSLPDGQVCEVINSVGTIVQNVTNLVVDCAEMVNVDVSIDVPDQYALTDLRLLSNFEALGGSGERAIDSDVASILAFKNTFISLLNEEGEALFLTFVGEIGTGDFSIDAVTTAISLLLLEPTISQAIGDRVNANGFNYTLFINAIIDGIENGVEPFSTFPFVVDAVAVLAAQIDLHIENGGQLNEPSDEITNALANAILAVSNYLSDSLPLPATAKTSSGSFQKVTAGGNASQVGADISFIASEESRLIIVTAKNSSGRFISLNSEVFASTQLSPQTGAAVADETTCIEGECIQYELPDGIASQQTLSIDVSGPGQLGEIEASNLDGLVAASSLSSVYQYFLPSLRPLLGLNNPFRFNVANCLSEQTLNSLATRSANAFNSDQDLVSELYNNVYAELALTSRTDFLSATIDSQIPIDELFDCDKFGIGVFIESNKFLAIENVRNLLDIANGVFSELSAVMTQDLFDVSGLNGLIDTVNSNQAFFTWELSNLLALTISADRQFVLENSEINFSGECVSPSTQEATDCTIQWSFGDGDSAEGENVSHVYSLLGEYTVTAMASDEDGAEISESLLIEVDEPLPRIRISDASGNPLNDPAFDYGEVSFGETQSVRFLIHNDGFLDLVIENFGSDNDQYVIDPGFESLLAPDENTEVSIDFTPSVLDESMATIHFDSNDPDNPRTQFQLVGSGVISSDGNYWTVERNGETQVFLVDRSVFLPEAADDLFEVRAFASTNVDFPQISVSLFDFDARGNAEYQLDKVCLGVYIETPDAENQFCTNAATAVGVASVSDGRTAGEKRVTFTFDAITRNCDTECETLRVQGDVFFDGSL